MSKCGSGHMVFIWCLVVVSLVNVVVCATRSTRRSRKSDGQWIPAVRACLPGPKINKADLNSNVKKCLIIGDSISIGYTHKVRKQLQQKCSVYHAPWDIGDGGALDTKHGVHCLDLLMKSSKYQNVSYDVIIFNFGLHDVDCEKNRPEEYTPIDEYTKNLRILKDYFLATEAKVAYALTTPVLDDCEVNNFVVRYNKAANDVMTKNSSVDVIDLYKVIVDLCGPAPSRSVNASDCPITNDTLIPHYTPRGYGLLADHVVSTIERLLKKAGNTVVRHDATLTSTAQQAMSKKQFHKHFVYCNKRQNGGWSSCPFNSTCVKNHMSGSGYGCCLSPNAIDCKTGVHCCPVGTACSHGCTKRRCKCEIN